MSDNLIDYKELFERLGTTRAQVKKQWREWPHVLVGHGNSLRNARFDYDEVVKFLKEQTNQKEQSRD